MKGGLSGWNCLVVVLGVLVARAHLALLKLLVIGLAGLAGLYLLHNLAQDVNKIQNSWNSGTGGQLNQHLSSLIGSSRNRRDLRKEEWLREKFPNDTYTMANLVQHDPIGCARKYVCYISSRSSKKQIAHQRKILAILRTFQWLDSDGEWQRAQKVGRRGGCERAYSRCGYSGRQLDRFMSMLG